MPKVCAVPGCCKTKNKNQKYSIFQVPQDVESRRKWEAAIPNIKHLKSSQHVCERHFEPECIVRKLLQRGPDGKIVIDINYKRPRLLESSVPSIFEFESSPAHEDTDKENNAVAVTEVFVSDLHPHELVSCSVPNELHLAHEDTDKENNAVAVTEVFVSELHPHELVPCSVPNAAPLKAFSDPLTTEEYPYSVNIDNTIFAPVVEETVTQLYAPDLDKLESSSEASNSNDVAASPCLDHIDLDSNDQSMIFSVKNEGEITFQLAENISTVTVSKPWSAMETTSAGERRLILFQIMINKANHDVPVIRISVQIDQKKKIQYAVHGMLVMNSEPYLPKELTDPRNLLSILKDFQRLYVCVGLKNIKTDLAEDGSVCSDNMNMNRSTDCMLLGKSRTCNSCVRLRKYLQQKQLRLKKHGGQFKRFPHSLSNPVVHSELNSMRLKVKSAKRAKNRAMKRIELLSDSLKHKQHELSVIKDQLLKQQQQQQHARNAKTVKP